MNWIAIITGLRGLFAGIRESKFDKIVLIVILYVLVQFWCEFKYEVSTDIEACSTRQLKIIEKIEERLL